MTLGFSSLKIEDNDEELSSILESSFWPLKPTAKALKILRKLEPESLERP